jgi:hypothetical protein
MAANHDAVGGVGGSGARSPRRDSLLVGSVFCAIGLWPALVHGHGPRRWALAIGGLLVIAALIAPRCLAPVHRVWMAAADVLGWINTRVLLGVVFYGLITPMGLVRRLFGGDPMRRRLEPGAATYRVPKRPRPGTHMTRQF